MQVINLTLFIKVVVISAIDILTSVAVKFIFSIASIIAIIKVKTLFI
jgi:hypothetical protein